MGRDEKARIDEVLQALYVRFIGKHSIDTRVEQAGMGRIKHLLEHMEDHAAVKDVRKRIKRYEEFKSSSEKRQDEAFEIARKEGITPEEAFERLTA